MSWRSRITGLLLLSVSVVPACVTDSVPTRPFDASLGPSQGADAAVDTGAPPPSLDAAPPSLDAAPGAGPEAGPVADGSVQPPPTGDAGPTPPPPDGGVSNGPCDLTGAWLITQHSVYQALGVRQAGVYWYYYEIEQRGSELTVKKGLTCGFVTVPIDLLGGLVNLEPSFPGMLKNNPHAGRRGNVSSSGSDCNVSFDRMTTVVGATCPYYLDESHPLPTTPASGSTPGWEDWDQDGHDGITLHITGLASGERYTVVRYINDWSGKFMPGAAKFKLSSDPEQIESVLGASSDLLKSTAETDADMSVHFAQFAKLQPGQVQGDDTATCAKIRELAPTLTPEASQ